MKPKLTKLKKKKEKLQRQINLALPRYLRHMDFYQNATL